MMPDQSQGACQAIEDAGALGTIFSKKNFNGNIREALIQNSTWTLQNTTDSLNLVASSRVAQNGTPIAATTYVFKDIFVVCTLPHTVVELLTKLICDFSGSSSTSVNLANS